MRIVNKMTISKTIAITLPVDMIISRVISLALVIFSGRVVVSFSGKKSTKKINIKKIFFVDDK